MLSVFCAAIGVILIYFIVTNYEKIKDHIQWRKKLSKLPISPRYKFLIGHLLYTFHGPKGDIFKLIREVVKASPPLFTFHMGPLVYVAFQEPDEIEALISSMNNLPKANYYNYLHEWLEDGLLTSKGQHWQTRRKILTPAFHFSILRDFVEIFTSETSKMIMEIEKNHLNKPVDIVPLISNFTLLTINETSMGTKLDTNTKDGLKYKEAIYQIGDIIYERILTPWHHLKFVFDNSFAGRTEKRLVNIMHNFTNNIIQKRSENFQVFKEPDNKDVDHHLNKRKYPLLDVLLNAKLKDNSINEKGIREEVNTFMFEGHDTTAVSLTFTCMLIACNKKIQDDLYQEIIEILGTDLTREPTYADLQNMTLMERCIKESLRLYPSVPFIGRESTSDVHTKYGIIPEGTTCVIHIYDLHRNEKFWENPDKFDPSRHLPENSRDRHPFSYIPFSAGPRNCIGQRFAMLELKAAICGLVRKFVLEPVDTPETLELIQDLVLRPKNGLRVKFLLRNT